MRLMSLMVVVDGRVREEEIRVFVYRMMDLRRRLAPDMMFSEGMVRDWFTAHREDLDETHERDAILPQTLEVLSELDMGARIVDAINAVAKADGHRHDSELAMITAVAEHWGVKVPRR